MNKINNKNLKVLKTILAKPIRAGIKWDDVENLFIALGAEIHEGRGSRLRVTLNNEKQVFHRPHPSREDHKALICEVRIFLRNAGVAYEL